MFQSHLLLSVFLFCNAEFTWDHNLWLNPSLRHERKMCEEGNLRSGLEEGSPYLQKFPRLSLKSRGPLSLLAPPRQPTCHPHLQGPIHHMAWNCPSQIQSRQITVKASPAWQQIPALTDCPWNKGKEQAARGTGDVVQRNEPPA